MIAQSKGLTPEAEAAHRARLALLANQLRLAEEELAIAVADCMDAGFSSRRVGLWIDMSHHTAIRMRGIGRAARDRRSRQPLEP